MKKIKLIDIAHGRSGDKGDAANIGIIALNNPEFISGSFSKACIRIVQYVRNDGVRRY